MPKIFADIGRSDIYEIGSRLNQQAIDIRNQETQGVIDMANLGMSIERFNIEKSAAERRRKIEEARISEIEEKNKYDNWLIPVESLQYQFGQTSVPNEFIEEGMKIATENGLVTTQGKKKFIKRKDFAQLISIYNDNTDIQKRMLDSAVTGWEREAMEIQSGISSGELKGKDLEQAQQRLNALINPKDGLLVNAYNYINNEIPTEEPDKPIMQATEHVYTAVGGDEEHGMIPGNQYRVTLDNQGNIVKVLGGLETEVDKPPASVLKLEYEIWGEPRPELRGTPEYVAALNALKQEAAANLSEPQRIEMATQHRKEFNGLPEVQRAKASEDNFTAIEAAYDESTGSLNQGFTDQAMITLYNKMTDPDSVVRESEYERTPKNLPFINRFEIAFLKIKHGGTLTNKDRKALVTMAQRLRDVRARRYNQRVDEYLGYIGNFVTNPQDYMPIRMIVNFSTAEDYLESKGLR